MKTLNEIYNDIEKSNIAVVNVDFKNKKAGIIHTPENTLICIDYSKLENTKEEKIVVAEEYEHYETGTFYKLNSDFNTIDRMEYKVRKHLYNKLIPFSKLKELILKNYTTEELSEYFEVPIKDILMAYFLYTNIENFAYC